MGLESRRSSIPSYRYARRNESEGDGAAKWRNSNHRLSKLSRSILLHDTGLELPSSMRFLRESLAILGLAVVIGSVSLSSFAAREMRVGLSNPHYRDVGSNHRKLLRHNGRGGERFGKRQHLILSGEDLVAQSDRVRLGLISPAVGRKSNFRIAIQRNPPLLQKQSKKPEHDGSDLRGVGNAAYTLILRRIIPATPSTPVPRSMRLPGSGVPKKFCAVPRVPLSVPGMAV